VVEPRDVLMVFSTSGKTREVIETVELARKLGVCKVIAVTSHPDSPIRALSDVIIDIGVIKEAGYLSLAPTTSIVAMLIAADAVATGCAKAKGLSKDDFGLRHHGGYLGRKCRGEVP
jgi:arabinose-5-phosphate isomerase